MYLAAGDKAEVVAHELGHWLEYSSPMIQKVVFEFYERRTQGDAPERLIDLLPYNNYRANELTLKDKWRDAYVGKIYVNAAGNRTATDVLAMGLQWFYENPLEMATIDEEFFDFIYEVLRMK